MTNTATAAPTTHYVVTMKGAPAGSRVSIWSTEEFNTLRAAKQIAQIWAVTPLTPRT